MLVNQIYTKLNTIFTDIPGSYIPVTHINKKQLLKIILISIINILCIYFLIIYAPINITQNKQLLFDNYNIYLLLQQCIDTAKDYQLFEVPHIIIYILAIFIYIIIYVYFIRCFYNHTIYDIYFDNIIDNRNYINNKYVIQNKSLLLSNILKEKMINNTMRICNIINIIVEVSILSIIFILFNLKKWDSLLYVLIYIPVVMFVIINFYMSFNISQLYINLICILIAYVMPDYFIILSILYLLNINMNKYTEPYIMLNNVKLKYFGDQHIDKVNEIIAYDTYITNNHTQRKSYEFLPNFVYILKTYETNSIDEFLYKIANRYFHNDKFYINNIQYSQIQPNFWSDIILIDHTFHINNSQKTIYDFIFDKTNNKNISDIYTKLQCTFSLYKPIIWNNLSVNQKAEIMLLFSVCSQAFIIIIPDFIFDNLTNQQRVIEYLKQQSTINIIATKSDIYKIKY